MSNSWYNIISDLLTKGRSTGRGGGGGGSFYIKVMVRRMTFVPLFCGLFYYRFLNL